MVNLDVDEEARCFFGATLISITNDHQVPQMGFGNLGCFK